MKCSYCNSDTNPKISRYDKKVYVPHLLLSILLHRMPCVIAEGDQSFRLFSDFLAALIKIRWFESFPPKADRIAHDQKAKSAVPEDRGFINFAVNPASSLPKRWKQQKMY